MSEITPSTALTAPLANRLHTLITIGAIKRRESLRRERARWLYIRERVTPRQLSDDMRIPIAQARRLHRETVDELLRDGGFEYANLHRGGSDR